MMKRSARIVAVLFLVIITMISLRYALFISYMGLQKAEFRAQIIAKKSEHLKCVRLASNELYVDTKTTEWKEANKELVINGVYHEVLTIRDSANFSIITVVEDTQENKLFASFFSLQKKEPLHFGHQLLAFLNFLFTEEVDTYCPQLFVTKFTLQIHPNDAVVTITIYPEELPPAFI